MSLNPTNMGPPRMNRAKPPSPIQLPKRSFDKPESDRSFSPIQSPETIKQLKTDTPDYYSALFRFPFYTPPSKSRPQDVYISLFGANLQSVHFEQGTIGDCYLLAGFDAILRHPERDRLLRKIKIRPTPDQETPYINYQVRFPVQDDQQPDDGRTVTVCSNELEAKEQNGLSFLSGPVGLKLLEMAYARMNRAERNAKQDSPFPYAGEGYSPLLMNGGSPGNALSALVGGKPFQLIAYNKSDNGKIATIPFSQKSHGPKNVKKLLSFIQNHPDHVYLMSAGTPNTVPSNVSLPENHALSIRAFDLAQETITLADPRNTKNLVFTIPLQTFYDTFCAIEGVSVKKSSL